MLEKDPRVERNNKSITEIEGIAVRRQKDNLTTEDGKYRRELEKKK